LTLSNHFNPFFNCAKVGINHPFIVKADVSITFVDSGKDGLTHLKYLQLPEGAAVIDNQLVYPALAQHTPPSPPPGATRRVVKYHRVDS